MKSAVLSIGTEILFGQIDNTNSKFLSRELNNIGFDVLYHYTVGDNKYRLKETIREIFQKCDIIITTGGLGPTQDDLTKEAIVEVMEDKLILDKNILDNIEKYFKKRNKLMTENNKKQAFIPSRGIILENNYGSAPGFILEKKGKIIIALPGPPFEMESMYSNYVRDYIKKYSNKSIYYKFVKTVGIGESEIETKLYKLIDEQTDPTIATYLNSDGVYLRVTSKRDSEEEAKKAVEGTLNKINDLIGEYVYETEDISLSEKIVALLKEKNLTISAAESCTGGLFASSIVDVSGASKVFDRSIITYSNKAKVEELDVRETTLQEFGAVSDKTAIEMVEGLYKKCKSDICIAVTGIAGPEVETSKKEIGLVYIALKYDGKIICIKETFGVIGRQSIRNRSVTAMMKFIYDTIGDNYEKR